MQYQDGLIREDILAFDNITGFKQISMVLKRLQGSVGAVVSYKSIAGDIECSPSSVKKYVDILEASGEIGYVGVAQGAEDFGCGGESEDYSQGDAAGLVVGCDFILFDFFWVGPLVGPPFFLA